jgi:hypothetical protein
VSSKLCAQAEHSSQEEPGGVRGPSADSQSRSLPATPQAAAKMLYVPPSIEPRSPPGWHPRRRYTTIILEADRVDTISWPQLCTDQVCLLLHFLSCSFCVTCLLNSLSCHPDGIPRRRFTALSFWRSVWIPPGPSSALTRSVPFLCRSRDLQGIPG